jgi:hypothetical protein
MLLSLVANSLAGSPHLHVIHASSWEQVETVAAEAKPPVLIFDLSDTCQGLILPLLVRHPHLLLVGLDAERNHALLLSGQETHSFTMDQIRELVEGGKNEHTKSDVDKPVQPFRPPDIGARVAAGTDLQRPGGAGDGDCPGGMGNKKSTQRKSVSETRGEAKMKSMSKRNKSILAAGGLIVLLAVVVAVVFSQQGGAGLFGSGLRTITPSDPSMHVGQTVEMVVDAFWGCDWSSSDPAVVSFAGDPNNTKVVTVQGDAIGQAEIRAKCAGGTYGTTVVSVALGIWPESFGMMCRSSSEYRSAAAIDLNTGNHSTRWTLSDCQDHDGRWIAYLNQADPDGSYTWGSVLLIALDAGSCTVNATTDGMTDSINFHIDCPAE